MPFKKLKRIIIVSSCLAGLSACASIDPRTPQVEMPVAKPIAKITNYTQALMDLGMMTEIYDTPSFKIQCNPVGDNTGSSASTGAEIPRDITEIMKSALNSIGGRVVFIPYDPAYFNNSVATGYSTFANKVRPDVVLTGGITEFDRGLESKSSNTDANLGHEFEGLPENAWFPSKSVEMRYGQGSKSALSRITLDFNLLNFETMTGIPRMNTTNSMEVHKGLSEQELGISIFGQSFGGKGSIKKVQGRHAAVRLLVELSMIQVVGKHLRLPYWRLLGEGAKPDRLVVDEIARYYQSLTNPEIISVVQQWLYLYGFPTEASGQMDALTQKALATLLKTKTFEEPEIDFKTFYQVYMNIPLTMEARQRREMLR